MSKGLIKSFDDIKPPGPGLEETPVLETQQVNDIEISRLSNSIYFFLDLVFICFIAIPHDSEPHPEMNEKNVCVRPRSSVAKSSILTSGIFKLEIIHRGRVLIDKQYKNLKAAKIAFAKFKNEKTFSEEVTPVWSEFYSPEKNWLKEHSPHLVN